jgi:hypothetical protein
MEPKLKKFSVIFDFGNNTIHSTICEESEENALYAIREALEQEWPFATFNKLLINHKLLQAVEIIEIEEKDDCSSDSRWRKTLEYEASRAEARIDKIARQGQEIIALKHHIVLQEAKIAQLEKELKHDTI